MFEANPKKVNVASFVKNRPLIGDFRCLISGGINASFKASTKVRQFVDYVVSSSFHDLRPEVVHNLGVIIARKIGEGKL
jgi:hypothetical protein